MVPDALRPYAKAAVPFLATLLAIAVQWAVTGAYDKAELVTTITGLGSALLTFLVANEVPTANPDPVPELEH